MRTQLSRMADHVLEATVLVAVVTVPLFFHFYSARVFEGEKAGLLRALALVAAVAWLIRTLEGGRISASLRRRLRDPLVLGVLATGAVAVLASLTSIAPRLSIWGSYQRSQGLFTTLAYLILFFATLTTFRTPMQRDRLLRALLVASGPIALYAVVQYYNLDPLPWVRDDPSRVFSTLSNPIFLGAYLTLLVPLTLLQLGRCLRVGTTAIWGLLGYAFLLAIQLVAIVASGSRGPLLGLGAGLFLFALLMVLLAGRHRLAAGLVGLGAAAILFAVALNLSATPLAAVRAAPMVGRFGELFGGSTARVRVLIWESVVERFSRDPGRLLLGYGPESTYVALQPTTRPELRYLELSGRLADRTHNLTFEALVTTGVAGTLALLGLFAVLFWTALRALGLTGQPTARRLWVGLVGAGVVLGTVVPWLLLRTWAFAGLGAALGLAVAPIIYVLLVMLRSGTIDRRPLNDRGMLIVALLAALFGHLVERSVGIGVTATLTVFWVLAGLLGAAAEEQTAEGGSQVQQAPGAANRATDSLLVGLMLATLAFGFLLLEPITTPAAGRWVVLAGGWVLAGWLILSEVRDGFSLRTAWVYPVMSLGWLGLFVTVRWVSLALGGDAITLLMLYFTWVLVTVPLVAAFSWLAGTDKPGKSGSPAGPQPFASRLWLLHPALAAVTLGLIIFLVLPPLRADVYLQAAQANAEAGRWNVALPLFQQAAAEAPAVEEYQQRLAEAYAVAADLVDPTRRDLFFDAGRQALEQALALNPANAVQRFNLAHLYLLWAQGTSDQGRRDVLLNQAVLLYEQAAQAMPHDARVLDEWGVALLALGDAEAALARFQRALEIDPRDAQVYLHLGGLYRERGKADLALQSYQQAVELDPTFAEAYRAMADLYREQGDLVRAVEVQQRAAALRPTDFAIRQNLALLYRDLGRLDLALQEARQALTYAPAEYRPALQQFIASLEAEGGQR